MKAKVVLTVLLALGLAASDLFAAFKNGDLIQGSSGDVYVIHAGRRCGIYDHDQLFALGYKWGNVIKISDAVLNAIPKGPDITAPYKTPKEGHLIQSGSGGVFVIRAGRRCASASPEVLKANGFNPEQVIRISDADMNAIPRGPDVTIPPNPYKTARNGTLFRAGNGPVFVILDGKRCQINAREFNAMRYRWENIINISDFQLNAIPQGPDVTTPYKNVRNGDFLHNNNSGVFVIRDGKRYSINGEKQFTALGLKWENVIKVTDADLNAIPKGLAITTPYKTVKNGDLIQGVNGETFVIQGGKRCSPPGAKHFAAMGLKWGNLIKISDADMNAIPKGPDITTPYKTARNGDLLQCNGRGSFVVRDGKRCLIESPEQFKELGWKWDSVIVISEKDLEAIPEGTL